MSEKTILIVGYGLGVGDIILNKFASEGYKVAILARNADRLNEISNKHKQLDQHVSGYSADLSKPETLGAVYDQIIADFGSMNVVVYNATSFGAGSYQHSLEQLTATVNVNILSLHVTFNHFLAHWKNNQAPGRFLLTGGGLSRNGAWSVSMGLQAGAATKAYFKNFAESADATFSGDNIRTICITIAGMVFGGDNIKMDDPNPEASNAFRVKVADAYFNSAENAGEALTVEVYVSPN